MDDGISVGKVIGGIVVVVVVILALGWVIQGNDFFMYKYFAPRQEQVRRETFEQSKAYRQGVVQDLQSMQSDYVKAPTKEQKDALATIILDRYPDFPS